MVLSIDALDVEPADTDFAFVIPASKSPGCGTEILVLHLGQSNTLPTADIGAASFDEHTGQ